jgi:hypothetical protein
MMRTAVRCVLLFTLIGCVMCAYGLAAAAEEAAVIEDGVVLSPGAGDAPAPYPADVVDADSLTLSPTLAPLTVSAPGIEAVDVYSQGCVFVLDDLTFTGAAPYIADIWTSDSNSDPSARKTIFAPGDPIVFWTVLMDHPGGQLYQDLGFIKGGKLVKVIPNLDYGDVPPGSWYLLYQATTPPALGTYGWVTRVRGVGYSDLYGLPITSNRFTIAID